MGNHEPQRAPVVGGQGLTAVAVGQERTLGEEVLERQIRGVATDAVNRHPAGLPGDRDTRQHLAGRKAAPLVVQRRETGDAVEVGPDLGPRQRLQLAPRERRLLVDGAEDAQRPALEVDRGGRSVGENGPLVRHVLAGRDALGLGSGRVVHGRASLPRHLLQHLSHRFAILVALEDEQHGVVARQGPHHALDTALVDGHRERVRAPARRLENQAGTRRSRSSSGTARRRGAARGDRSPKPPRRSAERRSGNRRCGPGA